MSADGHRLFIAALGNNSVEVVDVQAGTRAGSITQIKEHGSSHPGQLGGDAVQPSTLSGRLRPSEPRYDASVVIE